MENHPEVDINVLPVGILAQMADFMLGCLSRDFSSLIPVVERTSKTVQYQKVLVDRLLQNFPSDNAAARVRTFLGN